MSQLGGRCAAAIAGRDRAAARSALEEIAGPLDRRLVRPAADDIRKLLEALLPSDMLASSFYRTYSAVTHGQFYGLMNFMTPAVQPDGTPFLQWRLPPDLLDSTIQIAIGAVRQPYLCIGTVMGWNQKEARLWDAEVHTIYNS